MNGKRIFFVMIGILVIVAAAIIGGAYEANQLLTKKAQTLSNSKLNSKVLAEEQSSLTKAKKDVAKYQQLETIARTIVPQDKNQAEAVREINNLAADSGVTLSSVTLPASTLGITAPATGSSSSGPASSSATPSTKTDLTQLTPVKEIPGLYVLPITVAANPDTPAVYSKFIDFLSRLEQNRRTSQVSSISLQPNPNNPTLISFTLVIDEYIKP